MNLLSSLLKPIFFTAFLLCMAPITLANNAADAWQAWAQTLASAVDDEGNVDYDKIQQQNSVKPLVEAIAQTDPASFASEREALSFYINAYNLLAIDSILEGRSPSSFFGRLTYFKRHSYSIAGQEQTLYELEHDTIRPFNEPRIHFAIVCASQSCPKLFNKLFTIESYDLQLNQAATDFINNPDKNSFNQDTKTAYLSKIFDWFEEDFVYNNQTLLDYVANFVDDKALGQALQKNDYDIKFNRYDWNLNGTFSN